MKKENLSNLLIHYGDIIQDIQLKKENERIRIFKYNGKYFYHYMKNGELKNLKLMVDIQENV